MVCQWFGLKTTGTVFSGLALKPVAMIFFDLTSKPVAQVFRFGPQNRWLEYSGLGLKIKQTSVYRLHHKTNEGRVTRDMRQDLAACFAWK
jgi:hypothetical protein